MVNPADHLVHIAVLPATGEEGGGWVAFVSSGACKCHVLVAGRWLVAAWAAHNGQIRRPTAEANALRLGPVHTQSGAVPSVPGTPKANVACTPT